MRIALFSAKSYDERFFEKHRQGTDVEIDYFEARLLPESARLAKGYPVVCPFVSDDLSEPVLEALSDGGTELLALRSAGFNHVDLEAAERLGIKVMRVPEYSPHAVAEHTLALMLAINRKIHRAYYRAREQNFSLDGLMGFDMHGKTAGVIGTGSIGTAVVRLLLGMGCKVVAHAHHPSDELREAGVEFVDLEELYRRADIVTLHVPLTPKTKHMIDGKALDLMKDGVMLVNTCRGKVVDTAAVIRGLKSGKVGYFALDVYEEEGDIFYRDLSDKVIPDEMITQLLAMPNVIITGHQAYFTREALDSIAGTTIANIQTFEAGEADESDNLVQAKKHRR